MNQKVTLGVTLPTDVLRELRDEAARQDRSPSWIIRQTWERMSSCVAELMADQLPSALAASPAPRRSRKSITAPQAQKKQMFWFDRNEASKLDSESRRLRVEKDSLLLYCWSLR